MAYNNRRGEGINSVGARRNAPMSNNFVPAGQLTPQNRPMQHQPPRPQGFQNQSNGNFRPQMQQRMPLGQSPRPQGPPKMQQPPPQQQQQQPPPQQHPPQQQQQHPPPQQQQQQQPQQQQQQPPPQPMNTNDSNFRMDESMQQGDAGDEQVRRKPFWASKLKIPRKERLRRRNIRLSKMLQPKNAVMILNELVKSATYTVADLPQPSEMNQYTATVVVDGVSHVGHGRSKMEAKSMAAENALKYIVKNRQFSALKTEEQTEEKMEVTEEGGPSLPWQHVASFALYKLLNSWGEDPNQARGSSQLQDNTGMPAFHNRPAKRMPENADHMNPLMLLNQMLPQAQFEELDRTGNPPNVVFTFKCTVDGQTFTGTGSNKKAAKKMAAFAVCSKILNIQYPPEIYAPAN